MGKDYDYTQEKICRKAKEEVNRLASYVIDDLREFSEKNDYELPWVIEQFRESFSRKANKILEQ